MSEINWNRVAEALKETASYYEARSNDAPPTGEVRRESDMLWRIFYGLSKVIKEGLAP